MTRRWSTPTSSGKTCAELLQSDVRQEVSAVEFSGFDTTSYRVYVYPHKPRSFRFASFAQQGLPGPRLNIDPAVAESVVSEYKMEIYNAVVSPEAIVDGGGDGGAVPAGE